jgi:hypothetical protein
MYSVCDLETRKSSALPLQPWFPTGRQLTPVAGRTRPQLQLRYSHPRRAGVRRSCEPAFVHRKNRFSPGDIRTRTQGCSRNANSKRGNPARCRCKRGFRPAPGSRRSLDESVRNCNCVTHTHGRLTCAALDSAVVLRQTSVGVDRNRGPSPTTAGSRPPLLRMCVRASHKSFFRRETFAPGHKSGGRKPPVVRYRRRQSPATLRKRSCKCASLTPTAG